MDGFWQAKCVSDQWGVIITRVKSPDIFDLTCLSIVLFGDGQNRSLRQAVPVTPGTSEVGYGDKVHVFQAKTSFIFLVLQRFEKPSDTVLV